MGWLNVTTPVTNRTSWTYYVFSMWRESLGVPVKVSRSISGHWRDLGTPATRLSFGFWVSLVVEVFEGRGAEVSA